MLIGFILGASSIWISILIILVRIIYRHPQLDYPIRIYLLDGGCRIPDTGYRINVSLHSFFYLKRNDILKITIVFLKFLNNTYL